MKYTALFTNGDRVVLQLDEQIMGHVGYREALLAAKMVAGDRELEVLTQGCLLEDMAFRADPGEKIDSRAVSVKPRTLKSILAEALEAAAQPGCEAGCGDRRAPRDIYCAPCRSGMDKL